MKSTFFIALFIVIASLFSSCKKEDATKNTVTIEIQEPNENQVFSYGEELHVSALVKGTEKLFSVNLTVKNTLTGETLISYSDTEQEKNYFIHEHVFNTVLNQATISIIVEAKISDSETKTISRNVVFIPQ
ncbi:MAG: hypothetical protein ACK476_13255 [Fluviicola sp.]